MRLFKLIFLLGIAPILSCDDRDPPKSRRLRVEIYRSDIPPRGTVGQQIPIEASLSATNGCYSDLEMEMVEIDSRHYLLKATGAFITFGACPEEMVYQDTIVYFQPTLPGAYFFQVNQAPFDVRRDTLLVN